MKLLRLKADGFGLLRGEYTFDPDRVAIVIDDNERGKTSLLGALTAGLYGLDGDGRRARGLVTPLERWRPWDGGPYRVELDLEAGGERLYIKRDFARGTVEVWNARGQDIAHEFLVGKDGYPVGHKLLGLDAEEFAKCAWWRQGELDHVVPHEEKDRRASTLHTRLENAADTRAGDASAVEAQRALRAAVEKFHSPLLGTTLRIENALSRLQIQRDTLETELRALEHEHRSIAAPLDDLARLEEEERAARARIAQLERHLVRLRAEEARVRLDRDTQRRVELDALRAEAAALAAAAAVPDDAESVLREKVASLAAGYHALAALTARATAARGEADRIAAELDAFEPWAVRDADDADRLAGAAAALRRIAADHDRSRADLDRAEANLLGADRDRQRVDTIVRRFESCPEGRLELLRRQPRLALTAQGDVAAAEFLLNAGRDSLHAIAAWKRPRYWFSATLLGLGLGGAVGAAFVPAELRAYVLAGAGALALGGVLGLGLTARARRRDHDAALHRIAVADDQLRNTRLRAIENDTRLAALAADIGCADAPELLDEWSEFQRIRDQYVPLRAARDRVAVLERQRQETLEQAAAWIGDADPGSLDAEDLEAAAARIRERLDRARAHAESLRRVQAAEEEVRTVETGIASHRATVVAAIAAAGLAHDGGEAWSAWIDAVALRVRQAARFRMLSASLIPALERELLDDRQRESHLAEIARGEPGPHEGPMPASPAEAASEIATLRQRLDGIARAREELRLRVEGVAQRYHQEHPEKLARIEAFERELARTERFRDAVAVAAETIERVALDTHRRWAEFLNERVTAVLAALGSSIARVRFGEDLDFAVTLADGQQIARGKALHQLSSGARDQLHLAVRLAISEYLSRGAEPIPLLVDDCFATSDDGRARNGMRLLLESFSRKHQIVMVTCHRERQRALADMDRELYAERVQWVELRPVAVV